MELSCIQIYLLRSGDIDKQILQNMVEELHDVFQTEITIYNDTFPTLTDAYDTRRDQYLAETYIEYIRAFGLYSNESIRIVVVTSVDLFSPMMNYVFGIAEHPGKGAIVSTFRLHFNTHDKNLIYQRLLKEVMHEIGHMFGLSHCDTPTCVMAFASNVLEVDTKERTFCDKCSALLQR